MASDSGSIGNTVSTAAAHGESRVALLSNANADFIIRLLSADSTVYRTEGYGDIWGPQLDAQSALARFAPTAVFLLVDAQQLFASSRTETEMRQQTDTWYALFEQCRCTEREYFISDIQFRVGSIADVDAFTAENIEHYWLECLQKAVQRWSNVHRFPVNDVASRIGKENFYSAKSWFAGKIPYTAQGCRALAEQIRRLLQTVRRVPKKVLVLDLDNTLWGGVLGEDGLQGIRLSDDGIGAAYKEWQQTIQQMQAGGVLLAVCSKNNEADAREVMEQHPHMLLRWDTFVSHQVNWADKAENLQKIAQELNLGLDSFVFVDDMPAERENIRLRLPMVTVPDFPAAPEQLPQFAHALYAEHFQKLRSTAEDAQRTRQYQENRQREQAMQGLSYEDYLKSLHLKAERVPNTQATLDRAVQLFQKTNQFNLTTKRYTAQELGQRLADGWELYVYHVTDKFGDYGLVAVILLDTAQCRIDSFLMSCRIMGKQLENFFLDQVETELTARGQMRLQADYIPTDKNLPVKDLYPTLGYQTVSQEGPLVRYEICLQNRNIRKYFVEES